MADTTPHNPTLSLFHDVAEGDVDTGMLSWPSPQRFPLNLAHAGVGDVVLQDLRSAASPLIVTGYAGLDQVIDFIADCPQTSAVRLLLGNEPFDSRRDSFELGKHSFPREVEKYWLARGISLLLSAKLILCIERLKARQVQARYLPGGKRLHAKVYLGDEGVTLGSSNFTRPGLYGQHEANVRFTRKGESARYQEASQIAENYWQLGSDYNAQLIALLERLLKVVPWQEAMARACAELLEGEWAQAYLQRDNLADIETLWPSQRKGIAEALYILDNHGSVLVADATGSGKTRMGVNLIGAVRDHILRSNRLRRGMAMMICPPTVKQSWNDEAMRASTPLNVYSHGELSHGKSRGHDHTVEALRRAQILCVDEGHNFLNIGSARTQHLLRNMADHVLLFTATPINKSATDLLRIANMLGADNLEESTIKSFRQMLGAKKLSRSLTEDEISALREEINRFSVRRTKSQLNHMVDQEPEQYRDHTGKTCRYPEHRPQLYGLHESERDREIAMEIRQLADQLHAVSHFVKPIEMPKVFREQGLSEEKYLQGRLNSASKIAAYMIMVSLRSSRISLAEHIHGTRKAMEDFGLRGFRKQNMGEGACDRLEGIMGQLPENRLSIALPEWLTDVEAHKEASRHDYKIYKSIYRLIREMSDGREQRKAALLRELIGPHQLVLAFDSRPITLAYIEQAILAEGGAIKVITATGDSPDKKQRIMEAFKHGSTRRNLIGLCSDSLSEGVNLQQASVMVHLDMPSVVRIAEQRVGRVDRMDSPHEVIDVWWPDDATEFGISSDERFIERYETVDSLLGSNMPLPDKMTEGRARTLSAKELLQEYEQGRGHEEWDGISDAFSPVRRLVEGRHALVAEKVYQAYRHSSAKVLSRVSLVRARTPWAFFCLSAGSFETPRWLMIHRPNGKPLHQLEAIAAALRERLVDGVEELAMNAQASRQLKEFIDQLTHSEKALLPRRKQRALEEMEAVIKHYLALAGEEQEQQRIDAYTELLHAITQPQHQPNWDEVASRWLDLIRPIWHEQLQSARVKLLLLRDIRPALKSREAELGPKIIEAFAEFPMQQPLDERIIACIVGVAG
ncbi:MAG: helicase [Gammaproteobacteria bacterium]|nr:helicase [Gammaproteobacteria bacterium]